MIQALIQTKSQNDHFKLDIVGYNIKAKYLPYIKTQTVVGGLITSSIYPISALKLLWLV